MHRTPPFLLFSAVWILRSSSNDGTLCLINVSKDIFFFFWIWSSAECLCTIYHAKNRLCALTSYKPWVVHHQVIKRLVPLHKEQPCEIGKFIPNHSPINFFNNAKSPLPTSVPIWSTDHLFYNSMYTQTPALHPHTFYPNSIGGTFFPHQASPTGSFTNNYFFHLAMSIGIGKWKEINWKAGKCWSDGGLVAHPSSYFLSSLWILSSFYPVNVSTQFYILSDVRGVL